MNQYFIIGGLILSISTYFVGHSNGFNLAKDRYAIQVAEENAKARDKELFFQTQIDDLNATLQKELSNAQNQTVIRNNAISTGAMRLSIPTTSSICAPKDSSIATTDNPSRAELDPETAQNLVAIAEDGDQAILKLNACIAAYNSIGKK